MPSSAVVNTSTLVCALWWSSSIRSFCYSSMCLQCPSMACCIGCDGCCLLTILHATHFEGLAAAPPSISSLYASFLPFLFFARLMLSSLRFAGHFVAPLPFVVEGIPLFCVSLELTVVTLWCLFAFHYVVAIVLPISTIALLFTIWFFVKDAVALDRLFFRTVLVF